MARPGLVSAALTISVLACGIGFSVPATAKLTRLEIASQQSYGVFRPGEHRRLEAPGMTSRVNQRLILFWQ
jgi:hypothetical protein